MIRFLLLTILVLLAARVFWRVVDNAIEAAGGRRPPRTPDRAITPQRDPICGMFVPVESAVPFVDGKTTFYFCSIRCRAEFEALMKAKRRQA